MDWNNLLSYGSLVMLVSFVGMSWRQIKQFLAQLRGHFIITIELERNMAVVASHYMINHFTPSKFGTRRYFAWYLHVVRSNRPETVPFEKGMSSRLFWKGWVPIWFNAEGDQGSVGHPSQGLVSRDDEKAICSISFPRYMIDREALVIDMCRAYDEKRRDYDPDEAGNRSRYRVKIFTGSAGRLIGTRPDGDQSRPAVASEDGGPERHTGVQWSTLAHRMLAHSIEDFNYKNATPELCNLFLCDDAKRFIDRIRKWSKSEAWYKSRGITWKIGACLCGPPGTGKTSMVRAIAKDLDMPVLSFDVATLRNDEMRFCWSDALTRTPCICLLEDIDSVFDERVNISGRDDGLTFDCLINCIDGVEEAQGLVVIATTNHEDKLDPALLRSGRLENIVHTRSIRRPEDAEMIITRILAGYPDLQQQVLQEKRYEMLTQGITGAAVEQMCIEAALDRYWQDHDEAAMEVQAEKECRDLEALMEERFKKQREEGTRVKI